jgi:hypothetical protein
MERRGWPSCLRDDLQGLWAVKDLTPRQQQQILDVQLTPHVDNTCARLNNASHRSARSQKPGRLPCRVDSTLCISTTSYVPHSPPSRRAWSWSAAERQTLTWKPAPRTKAAARLDLEVSVGWASPSSRGLCGGDALLLKGHFLSPSKPYSCHSQLSLNRGPYA